MPRTKETRNFSGSTFRREIKKEGKTIAVWDVRKRYKNAAGEQKEKFRRCYSAREASTALTNFQTDIEKELSEHSTKKRDATFFQLVEYFKKEYVKEAVFTNGRQVGGYRQSLKTINNILDEQKEFFGNVPLRRISYETIKNYSDFITTKKTQYNEFPKVSTVNKKLTFLRRVFNIGIQLEWIDSNPFQRGGRLIHKAAENRRNRMMTYDEEARLLAACTGRQEYLRAWIIAAVDTAMRRGDIYNLRWRDVDLDEGIIEIAVDRAKQNRRRRNSADNSQAESGA
jgi:integrase